MIATIIWLHYYVPHFAIQRSQKQQLELKRFLFLSELDDEHRNGALRHWYQVASNYTHRILSEPGDRLSALSGVAARFGRILDREYCAGLWRHQLPQELVSWIPEESRRRKIFTLRRRPVQYLSPSWSWGGVDFPMHLHLNSYKSHKSFKTLHYQRGFHNNNQINVFGVVTSGVLVVHSCLRQAHMTRKHGCNGYESVDYELKLDGPNQVKDESSVTEIPFIPDYVEEKLGPENDAGPIPVFLMIVTDKYKGIVLRKVASERYSRVGVLDGHRGVGLAFGREDWPGDLFIKWIN